MADKIYTAAMTGCSFMHNEMKAMLPLLLSPDADTLLKKEISENNILLIKSETSRKKAVLEFKRRFNAVPREFWEWFSTVSESTQLLAMFFVNLKTYRIYFDFQVNVVLNNWNGISRTVTYNDILSEFYQISASNAFVDSWSKETKDKITTSFITMLRKVGLLDAKTSELRSPQVNEEEFAYFLKINEAWFLDACLLEPYVINRIKSYAV
ncbi:MAG: BrxA family protein [Muribaculaceae bacterium]